jgi:hypothetical protein
LSSGSAIPFISILLKGVLPCIQISSGDLFEALEKIPKLSGY